MPRLSVSPVAAARPGQQTGPGILFLLKGYPRLSETFIAQEIRALEEGGLPVRIVSLRFPTDKHVHPIHREIVAPVTYLPEYLIQEPARVLRGWWRARRLPGYRHALRVWLGDLRRDSTTNRGRRFGQACVLAAEIIAGKHGDVRRLHAHFLHTPAAVAYYTSLMTGIPWSCSAHAKDIWTTPDWEIREKLASLDWLVTCTAGGHHHLQDLAADPGKVSLVYHGLDFRRFPLPAGMPDATSTSAATRAPDAADGPLVILSVGRAVPKKGYGDLLRALARLPAALDWRFRHIGGGPELDRLKALAAELGIANRIDWRGAQPQQEVLAAYRAADLFVLASCIAENGDRDGLPNVLMEAQSQELPVIATAISGVPELIRNGETGLLVPPNDPAALADAIAELLVDPERRRSLAIAGAQRLRADFAMETGIADLARRFACDLRHDDANQAFRAAQGRIARQSAR
ncbi:glycosyltransferase [Dongia soli]|uniref:Glycosyltransferase n=1 Tax=Dongia soli TaxID=600628 RepID=A0ABU5E769_9PROT|nr:glycosyltransferase [Dongia soli]MDY0882026.1 glycosyltransferase [Dongia soli]